MSVHRQQVRANLSIFECPPCPITSGALMADHRCPRLILADGPSTHVSSMETLGVQSRVRGISLVGGILSAHLYPQVCAFDAIVQASIKTIALWSQLQPADSPCVRRAAVSFHGQGLPDPRGRSDLRQVAVRGALLGSAARPPKLPASVSQPANQAHKGSLPLWSNMVSSPPALEKDIYMQV